MIKVTIFDNIDVIRSVVKGADESIRIAWSQETEKSPGYAVFSSFGEIIDINDKDGVSELLVRAALNYLDLRDVKIAICKNKKLWQLLSNLGFHENNGHMEVNIKDFFRPCHNK